MNRRGFFAGLAGVLGFFGVASSVRADTVNDEPQAPTPHEHRWQDTPYVLVFGETTVQRGPSLVVCKTCGELRVHLPDHRDAMLQAAYDSAHRAVTSRSRGFAEYVDG